MLDLIGAFLAAIGGSILQFRICSETGKREQTRRCAWGQCSVHWPELTAAIEEFRAVRGRTLDIAAGLSDEQAGKRVRTGTWSVAEVLDHLVRAEVAFRKYQRQAVERAWAGATGTIRIGFREVDTRLRPLPMSWRSEEH